MWIFAYGGLMWKPCFKFSEQHRASLHGYKRSLCVKSMVHRGTPEFPGLVFGVAPVNDGVCTGIANRIDENHLKSALSAIRQTELVRDVYLEKELPIELENGTIQTALTYVINPDCREYEENHSVAEIVRRVAYAQGRSGSNFDYLLNSLKEMTKLGVKDNELEYILELARDLQKPQNQ